MAHTKLGRGRRTRRKECGGEENKDKLVPPLEGWFRRKLGITRWREACVCAVEAARAGKGCQAVPSSGSRPVTPGEGGARRAGRQQRGSGQAAAHAAQSPGVARRGRGETYTGPPGPAQRWRRGLLTDPPPPRARALCPASLQVTLAAGGKLQEEGSAWMGITPVDPRSVRTPSPPRLCLNLATLGNLAGV